MKEIDRIAERVKALQRVNSPFMVAMITPQGNKYDFSYNIHKGEKTLLNGVEQFSTRELAKADCQKLIDKYNIPDDRSIVINIISPKGDANG